MKWPDKLDLCKECIGHSIAPWFKNKIEEWVDMDYPYSTFRPSLLVCARKDLCPDCAERLIECVDRLNEYPQQQSLSTEELEKAWKDCHGWGY